jgi:hypothetical protein
VGVAKAVRERDSSSFYPSEDTSGSVAISLGFVSEIEAMELAGVLEGGVVIDEERGVIDVVFLAKLTEESCCEPIVSDGLELRVE